MKEQQLPRKGPRPEATRLTATLDTISQTRPAVLLRLDSGQRLRATVEAHDPELLRNLFGKRVVVSGLAHFRMSGRPWMISVEDIRPAGPDDELWTAAPTPLPGKGAPVYTPRPQNEKSGVAAFFGTWPGDESPQELLAAAREAE